MFQPDKNKTEIKTYHRAQLINSDIFYNEYITAQDAINYSNRRVNTIKDIDRIIGHNSTLFVFDLLSLYIVFDNKCVLKIMAGKRGLECNLSDNMPVVNTIQSYILISDDGKAELWNEDILLPYTNAVFTKLHTERRIAWLYFLNKTSILTCTVTHVLEEPYTILNLDNEL